MTDPISKRFEDKKEREKLEQRSMHARSADDIVDEEAVLKRAKEERAKNPQKYQLHASGTVGRNDPCPCGSGKKYKKCCGVKK